MAATCSESDALAPSLVTAGDYEACATKAEKQVDVLNIRGDAWVFLLESVVIAAPILGPLLIIIYTNIMEPNNWIMNCDGHPLHIELLCSFTGPTVRTFPFFALLFTVIFIGREFACQRAYYVLLQHNILVSFKGRQQMGFFMLSFLATLFLCVVTNFGLTLAYGNPIGPGEHYFNEPMTTLLRELVANPRDILDHNPDLLPYVMLISVRYIGPALITLIFFSGLDGIERKLMSLNEMLEEDPYERCLHLEKSIVVPEQVVTNILRHGLKAGLGGRPCNIAQLCQEINERARTNDAVAIISLPATAEYKAAQISPISPGICALLHQSLYINWWPVQLLVDYNLIDAESVSFKQAFGCYFLISCILVVPLCLNYLRRFFFTVVEEASRWGFLFPGFTMYELNPYQRGPSTDGVLISMWLAFVFSATAIFGIVAAKQMCKLAMNLAARAT